MRYSGRKVDQNQKAIMQALAACGCSVASLHRVGQGIPDLLVGCHGRNLLLEVKPAEGPHVNRKDQPEQAAWREAWRGQVAVVRTIDEALKAVAKYGGGA